MTAGPSLFRVVVEVGDLPAAALNCLSADGVHGEPAGEIRDRPWGERSFYATDPWGNPVCLVAPGTAYTGR